MIEKSPLWITAEEGTQIVNEIVNGRKDTIVATSQTKEYADVHLLFIDRCTRCHTINRILKQNKTREEWLETIQRMRENAPELFLDEDIPILTEYLAERGKIMRDDVAAQIVVEKCLICHEMGRILLERKSRRGWEDCVTVMRALAREKFQKDWFTSDEFRLIVDLLVETQGSP
jgi:antitoxin component of MazEF toxin-antitoxin module